jgi:hypothetical protein
MRSRPVLIAVLVLASSARGACTSWVGSRPTRSTSTVPSPTRCRRTGGAGPQPGGRRVRRIVTDATGTWTVDTEVVAFDTATGAGTWVGYRIDEELVGAVPSRRSAAPRASRAGSRSRAASCRRG